jgi:hypothetical protein
MYAPLWGGLTGECTLPSGKSPRGSVHSSVGSPHGGVYTPKWGGLIGECTLPHGETPLGSAHSPVGSPHEGVLHWSHDAVHPELTLQKHTTRHRNRRIQETHLPTLRRPAGPADDRSRRRGHFCRAQATVVIHTDHYLPAKTKNTTATTNMLFSKPPTNRCYASFCTSKAFPNIATKNKVPNGPPGPSRDLHIRIQTTLNFGQQISV